MATMTAVAATGDSTPGANSQATASLTPVDGDSYLIYVFCTRAASTDPIAPTVTGANGWNTTWTEVTGCSGPMTATGTTRRRSFLYKGTAVSSTAGAITFTYTSNTPELIDWLVINLGPTAAGITVDGSEKKTAAADSITSNTLKEWATMNAVAAADDRWIAFASVNTNATTLRGELDADTNGDADWTTINSFGSSSTRTRKHCSYYRDSTTDNTPGALSSDNAVFFGCAVEIDYNLTTPQTWTGTAGTLTVTAAAGSFTAGTASWVGVAGSETITATADMFAAAGVSWAGVAATLTVTGTAGSFTPGAVTWTGTTATATVTATAGLFDATAVWVGAGATLEATGTAGSFTATATWSGTAGTATVTATAGAFDAGVTVWAGAVATATIHADAGGFEAAGSSQAWNGDIGPYSVLGVVGTFDAGLTVWQGTGATVAVVATAGMFEVAVVWQGTTATFMVEAGTGDFGGATLWMGDAGLLAITANPGSFTPGAMSWVGAVALLTITATAGDFTRVASYFLAGGYREPRPIGYQEPRPQGYRQPRPIGHQEPRPIAYRERRPTA